MAKRKQSDISIGVDMPYEVRAALVNLMNTMAARRPHLEPVLMQLARAGELHEVEQGIKQRREYAKRARG